MRQYLELARDVLDNGERLPPRAFLRSTGEIVEAVSVFGRQIRFDLAEGFPLVTTKAVNFDSIVHELLWFLGGSTNIKYLTDNKVNIWNQWADRRGELGPVYGHAWRNFGGRPYRVPQPRPRLRAGLEADVAGVANGVGSEGHALAADWRSMIARCYDEADRDYPEYGGLGVHVADRWLEFAAFAADADRLPGWPGEGRVSSHVLDKDVLGSGYAYGPEACCWLLVWNTEAHAAARHAAVVAKGGRKSVHFFDDPAAEEDLRSSLAPRGYEVVSIRRRDAGVDQIARLVADVRKVARNPTASERRRLIVTAWDPSVLAHVGLPPCHILCQFNVSRGRLSCQLYQR